MVSKRVLNLGAGVGSTTVYLLAMEGKIPPIDAAIFADTHGEPAEVYRHLEWLQSLNGPPILVRSRGNLAEDLIKGIKNTQGRFISIPAFTDAPLQPEGKEQDKGQTTRQCTAEYKVAVVEKSIRSDLFGLAKRQRMPKDAKVEQLFGLHDDEPKRIKRVKERFAGHSWATPVFPLATIGWTRDVCLHYLRDRVPHQTPRSACVYCPFHSDLEWVRLRDTDPDGWQQAIKLDADMRNPTSVCTRGLKGKLYLHRSCVPLQLVDIDTGAAREQSRIAAGKAQLDLFEIDSCLDGYCGM